MIINEDKLRDQIRRKSKKEGIKFIDALDEYAVSINFKNWHDYKKYLKDPFFDESYFYSLENNEYTNLLILKELLLREIKKLPLLEDHKVYDYLMEEYDSPIENLVEDNEPTNLDDYNDIFHSLEREAEELAENYKDEFKEAFYYLWEKEGFGEPDLKSPEPWGCPWYHSTKHSYVTDTPEEDAKKYFEECKDELQNIFIKQFEERLYVSEAEECEDVYGNFRSFQVIIVYTLTNGKIITLLFQNGQSYHNNNYNLPKEDMELYIEGNEYEDLLGNVLYNCFEDVEEDWCDIDLFNEMKKELSAAKMIANIAFNKHCYLNN